MGNKEKITGVDMLMLKQKYLKHFDQLFIDLQDFSINGFFKENIQQFRYCIRFSRTQCDQSALPFFSVDLTSCHSYKNTCVLCVLSVAVQAYWELCNSNNLDLDEGLDILVTKLEEYAKNGRDAYKIVGEFPQFYLERKN